MFKVVTDQLKVSQGWVRCGQCSVVFDAQLHLQATPNAQLSDTPPHAPLFDASAVAAFTDVAASSYEQDVIAALKTPAPSAPDSLPVDRHAVSASLPAGTADLEHTPTIDNLLEQAKDGASVGHSNDVSFVRNARRQAFWRKPLVRALLALFAVALASLLGLQFAVQQRDALLAFEPRAKPWLQMLCEQLVCDLSVPRRIDAIVIDSSSFNKADGAGSYRLSFSLKNTSSSVVAMPSLEVSLTDSQDQAVVRRVLSPAQFGAANGMLAAGAEFSNALTLQVEPGSPTLRIAGYRLLAFYP